MSSQLSASCEGASGSQNNDGEVSAKFVPINRILYLFTKHRFESTEACYSL